MKFYMYSVYDPEVESFDSRLNLGPLEPKEMGEQYRRAHIKMNEQDKSFMEGKVAVCIGEFDDITGKIVQTKMLEIYRFEAKKPEGPEGQEKGESDKVNTDA